MPMEKMARLIAFYLPQFHPIPENDLWHGAGFTEWTNVAKAKPLFRGHYQPNIPADLGFYDLRVSETREAQAKLAREYGIEGFCYWHYWFGNGKRLLERPFNEVLSSGKPDFPFCLGWANDSWSGIWYGTPDRLLIEQTYPGSEDHEAHFYALLDAFRDKRYMTVDGKLIFLINSPTRLPECDAFTAQWRTLAVREGLKGFHFIGSEVKCPEVYGCDATVADSPYVFLKPRMCERLINKATRLLKAFGIKYNIFLKNRVLMVRKYKDLMTFLAQEQLSENEYPLVIPNWDNTPRSGRNGLVVQGSSPELFKTMLLTALDKIGQKEEQEQRIIFVKSWNEWAEGNYLEPDLKYGHRYLNVIKECIYENEFMELG